MLLENKWGLSPIFFDAVMRLPLTAFAAYFLLREWQALESAQGMLYIAAHVATMLFLAAVALMQLGRSLSIMPEARRLVTEGLYARIRHPLYLGEAIATIGVLLLYRIPAAFALVAIQFCLQLWRMREEEKVLAAAFPEYAEYRQRTARLIPGIY